METKNSSATTATAKSHALLCTTRMGPPRREDGIILGILLGSVLAIYLCLEAVTSVISGDPNERHWVRFEKERGKKTQSSWLPRLRHVNCVCSVQVGSLIFNLLGYSTVFLPGYLIIRYVRQSGYLEKGPSKCMDSLVCAILLACLLFSLESTVHRILLYSQTLPPSAGSDLRPGLRGDDRRRHHAGGEAEEGGGGQEVRLLARPHPHRLLLGATG